MIFFVLFHVFVTIALIIMILLQKGESGGLGSAQQNQALFSARGQANILTRTTAVLATLFIANCILMTIIASHQSKKSTQILRSVEQSK